LLFAFALNSIAHVTHRHDAPASATHHLACGYCAAFGGGLADAPQHSGLLLDLGRVDGIVATEVEFPARVPIRESARPRAPPTA
jgi:hypothetical protein